MHGNVSNPVTQPRAEVQSHHAPSVEELSFAEVIAGAGSAFRPPSLCVRIRALHCLLLLLFLLSLVQSALVAGDIIEQVSSYTVTGSVTNAATGAAMAQMRVRLVHYHVTNRVFLQT